MKFVNTAGTTITFELHGKKMAVGPGDVFEVEDRLAYALPLMGLPVAEWKAPPPEEPKPEPVKAEPFRRK